MTEKIHCLYLEDDPKDFETFSQIIKRSLKPIEVTYKHVTLKEEALDELDNHAEMYQLILVDYLIKDLNGEDIPQGKAVVEAALDKTKPVIVISKALDFNHKDGLDYLMRHILYLDKYRIKAEAYSNLREIILKELAQRGVNLVNANAIDLNWQVDDLRLAAEIDTISEPTLRALLQKLQPQATRFELFYVAPGYSGASTMRCKTWTATTGWRDLLIKFSLHYRRLKEEMDNSLQEGEPAEAVYVRYRQDDPVEYDAWYAISASFQHNAVTFLDWLADRNTRLYQLEICLEHLFVEHLKHAYVQQRREVQKSAVELLRPHLQKSHRILLALNILVPLIKKALDDQRAQEYQPELVEKFIRYWQIGNILASEITKGSFECMSHGDLHTRNILITQGALPLPRLIDTAGRGYWHWATDPARLCADLWLSAWDANEASYFWDSLEYWRLYISEWLAGRLTTEDSNPAVVEVLKWMQSNMRGIFEEVCGSNYNLWEFELALATEFLKMCPFESIAAPKRCLAVLAAHDILKRLEAEVPRLPHGYKE